MKFVDDVGFCFLFPIQGVEMPSLWDAIAGRVVKTTNKHSGYEIERTLGWKDEALDKKRWYYGKLIRDKATLISLDFLPNFYALSENFGDYEHDYLEEYKTGQLTAEAKQVYEALLRNGALDAVRLRRESHLSSDSSKGRFDKALTDLQTGLKVLPVGVAPVGAWRYAFIYEVLPRWYPEIPTRARKISRAEARQRILDQYLRNVIFSAVPAAARVEVSDLIEKVARLAGWSERYGWAREVARFENSESEMMAKHDCLSPGGLRILLDELLSGRGGDFPTINSGTTWMGIAQIGLRNQALSKKL